MIKGLPEVLAEFPSAKIVETLERIHVDDLGEVMNKYLDVVIEKLRTNSFESCNSLGLYFLMMNTITIFRKREEMDAVQNAIPALINRIVMDANDDNERIQAKKFADEFNNFISVFQASLKSMPN